MTILDLEKARGWQHSCLKENCKNDAKGFCQVEMRVRIVSPYLFALWIFNLILDPNIHLGLVVLNRQFALGQLPFKTGEIYPNIRLTG